MEYNKAFMLNRLHAINSPKFRVLEEAPFMYRLLFTLLLLCSTLSGYAHPLYEEELLKPAMALSGWEIECPILTRNGTVLYRVSSTGADQRSGWWIHHPDGKSQGLGALNLSVLDGEYLLAFSPDGTALWAFCEQNVRYIRQSGSHQIQVLDGPQDPDSMLVASLSNDGDVFMTPWISSVEGAEAFLGYTLYPKQGIREAIYLDLPPFIEDPQDIASYEARHVESVNHMHLYQFSIDMKGSRYSKAFWAVWDSQEGHWNLPDSFMDYMHQPQTLSAEGKVWGAYMHDGHSGIFTWSSDEGFTCPEELGIEWGDRHWWVNTSGALLMHPDRVYHPAFGLTRLNLILGNPESPVEYRALGLDEQGRILAWKRGPDRERVLVLLRPLPGSMLTLNEKEEPQL
jgi:hypothetical protein